MERQVRDIIDIALCQKIGNGFGRDHEVYSGCRYSVDEVMLRTVDLEAEIKRIMFNAGQITMDTYFVFASPE